MVGLSVLKKVRPSLLLLSEQISYCIVVYTLEDFLVVVIGIGGCQCHTVEILSG